MWVSALLVVAASAVPSILVSAQDISSLSPCGVECYNRVIASGLGCDSGDTACLCEKPDFGFGLRDCAEQACQPDDVTQLTSFSNSFCAAADTEPAPSEAPSNAANTPPVESVASPSPSQSADAAGTPSVENGSEPLPSTSSLENPETLVVPSTMTPTDDVLITTLSTVTSSQTSSGAESSGGQATASVPATGEDDDGEEDDSSAAPLATPAIIGIGVGAGVAAIGSALAVCLLCRRRRQDSRARSLQISEPMPGSGRDYSGRAGSIADKNLTELEQKSKRYEDMIPRQSPRSMI